MENPVTHFPRLKINFEETKTDHTSSLSSPLGFWLVLEPFRFCFVFLDLLVHQVTFRKVPIRR